MRQIAAALEAMAQGRSISLLAAQPDHSRLELTFLDESARPNNLPPQRTVLVGRAQELAQITGLLAQPGKRLVTIAATGGMGKTCLALDVAEEQLKARTYRDGVFLISLAPLSDLSAVLPALAEAVTFPIQANDPRTPRRQVLDYLGHKQMLLVFDNFEHLLDARHLVSRLLEAAPKKLTIQVDEKQEDKEKLNKALKNFIRKEIELEKKNATAAGKKNVTNSNVFTLTPEAQKLSSGFSGNKGSLPWPVEQGTVTGIFGDHPHPVLKGIT